MTERDRLIALRGEARVKSNHHESLARTCPPDLPNHRAWHLKQAERYRTLAAGYSDAIGNLMSHSEIDFKTD
jgi:hypothetical protein